MMFIRFLQRCSNPLGVQSLSVKHWNGNLNFWHRSSSSWPSWLSWFVRMRQTSRRSMIPTSEMRAQIYEKKQRKKSGEEMQHCWIAFIERPQVQRIPKQTSVLRSKRKGSPLVERRQSLFGQHGPGTVDSALVLAWWWVHVSSFHHIYWGSDHCGHKAGAKCRYKVTRQIVCGESWKTKRLKSMNDGNQRAYVLRSVVQKHVSRLYNPMSGDI